MPFSGLPHETLANTVHAKPKLSHRTTDNEPIRQAIF